MCALGRDAYVFESVKILFAKLEVHRHGVGLTTLIFDTSADTALELGFATYGTNTPCVINGKFLDWIDVQVPLLNGTCDVAAESVHNVGGPK